MLWICIGNRAGLFSFPVRDTAEPVSALLSIRPSGPSLTGKSAALQLYFHVRRDRRYEHLLHFQRCSRALLLLLARRYLEQLWGSLRVNLYYLIGILAMDVYAMLVYFLFHVSYGVSALYLNLSMFLSVAALMPEARGLLFSSSRSKCAGSPS